ncbi:phenylalanine--tRNA ligase subunit alpha, partial [Candidatus Peregrinibacteria bacterium]|nr:phenylalanine--tRNA ligase subunit alpha [Candidatus Peregrinibacteria bacterium]
MNWKEYEGRIQSAKSPSELEALEQELFGRKHGAMTLALKELSGATPDVLREKGKLLNEAKKSLTLALIERRRDLAQSFGSTLGQTDPIDITLELPQKEYGHLHLIPEFIRNVEEVFGRMGFDVAEGPEIESEELNFNLLNIPEHHPARDVQDTFWIKKDPNPKKSMLLRTQTSPIQIRYMQSHTPPFRAIFPGKVYRKDSDATHSPMFHQFEGLMIGETISLANMKAVMETAVRELIAPKAIFRWRTGYFPFVEPGLEMDMRWQGEESQTREGKWLEIVGCGMVHPNVLKNCGIDPKKWQGFAFGFGVERMIMIKHQIPDLR